MEFLKENYLSLFSVDNEKSIICKYFKTGIKYLLFLCIVYWLFFVLKKVFNENHGKERR